MANKHFEEPEKKRFYWQTGNPYIVSKEIELLMPLVGAGIKGPVLEVGCGEGANLVNLRQMRFDPFYYGVDFCYKKVNFASLQKIASSSFICGDAVLLPFKNGSFSAVLLRDILHHVDSGRESVLKEALRVCRESGFIFIIEGNGAKFANKIFRLIRSAERGMRNSTKDKIEGLLKNLHIKFYISMKEPSNLFRFFLHYNYGIEGLGKIGIVRVLLDFIASISERIISEQKWAYIVCVIKKMD